MELQTSAQTLDSIEVDDSYLFSPKLSLEEIFDSVIWGESG